MAALLIRLIAGLLIFGGVTAGGFVRPANAQDGSPDARSEWVRDHRRVERMDIPGRRVELATLKGATLFIGPAADRDEPVPLFIHFHGAPWLIEQHISQHLQKAALITVQLGSGSSVYGRPFEEERLFDALIADAEREADLERGWSSINLSGFSAGYGAIRSILRHPAHFKKVNAVLLLDGFHAGYESEAGAVSRRDIDSYVAFAREAAKGRKHFVITHSQIHPGAYASTTECTNALLRELKIPRKITRTNLPAGMQQLTEAKRGKLNVFGYAGETAADHVDHLHAMPYWFEFLGVR